eukprot:2384602-Amphidinium_carterae.1
MCAGGQVEVRKYVDDMVLIRSGPNFAGNLCFAYSHVLASLTAVNMRDNVLKTIVSCSGSVTNVSFGRCGALVGCHWCKSLLEILEWTRKGLRGPAKMHQFLEGVHEFSMWVFTVLIGGCSAQHMKHLRAAARGALGKGAAL